MDTGWKSPTGTGDNYNQWTNPTNAYSSDDNYATAAIAGASKCQDYTNFNFDIPAGATIDGVEISLEWYRDGTGTTSGRVLWRG